MLSPSMLCDTYTVFSQGTFDPSTPFTSPTATATILTNVRLSLSSGDRAVDAQGDTSACQAILFFFCGISRADGLLEVPAIVAGDRVAEGALTSVPATGRVWTVKGVKTLNAKSRAHHVEVNLV